jgi:hypothetical protein
MTDLIHEPNAPESNGQSPPAKSGSDTTVVRGSPDAVKPRRAWLRTAAIILAAAVAGGGAGFGASWLHPGPRGLAGQAGAQGVAGPAGKPGATGAVGPAGLAGSAAQVTGLGVCYTTSSNSNNTGAFWITSVYLTSPARHADGTTYCPSGDYVPVAPQTSPNGQ